METLAEQESLVGKTMEVVVLEMHTTEMLIIDLEVRGWSSGRRSEWQH